METLVKYDTDKHILLKTVDKDSCKEFMGTDFFVHPALPDIEVFIADIQKDWALLISKEDVDPAQFHRAIKVNYSDIVFSSDKNKQLIRDRIGRTEDTTTRTHSCAQENTSIIRPTLHKQILSVSDERRIKELISIDKAVYKAIQIFRSEGHAFKLIERIKVHAPNVKLAYTVVFGEDAPPNDEVGDDLAGLLWAVGSSEKGVCVYLGCRNPRGQIAPVCLVNLCIIGDRWEYVAPDIF